MRAVWEGHYLDGQSPVRHPAQIRIVPTGLQITLADTGAVLWWPLREVHQTQGFYAGEPVRLERGDGLAEALLVGDLAFLSALRTLAPDAAAGFHDPRRRRFRVGLTLVLAVATVGLALAIYFWLIPAGAGLLAARVPASWEASLGQAVTAQLAPPPRRCTDPERQRAIDAIMTRLLRGAPGQPYAFRVTVVDAPVTNALAAPGGSLLVFRGLLERTDSAEELAGVLAHEAQHVLGRHATRMILQQASTGILLAAMVGDVSGVMTYGVEAARTLGEMRYSRQYEDEADREGMRLILAARIDPNGMIAFFRKLERQGDPDGVLRYLSTHPAPTDRVRVLEALAAAAPARAEPLLPGVDWEGVKKICATRPSRRAR